MQINTTQTHQAKPAVNPASAAVEAVNTPAVQQMAPMPNAPAIPAVVPSAARQAQWSKYQAENALIREAQDTSLPIAKRVNTVINISDKKTQIQILLQMLEEVQRHPEGASYRGMITDALRMIDRVEFAHYQ